MDYQIKSNQGENVIFPSLTKVINKHIEHPFKKKPNIQQHHIFNAVHQYALSQNKPIIFDGGCGRGMSTEKLAQQYPEHLIIGLDKSIHRLSQNHTHKKATSVIAKEHSDCRNPKLELDPPAKPEDNIKCRTNTGTRPYIAIDNIVFVQADLFDFLLLAHQANWHFDKQFYFYQNPWPKSEHFKRRLHGHPIFPMLLSLSPYIEIRSNWNIYCQEFKQASQLINTDYQTQFKILGNHGEPMTHFEQKYWQAKETTYQVVVCHPAA